MLTQLSLAAALSIEKASTVLIDRKAVVSRHNVALNSFSSRRPLQVGNGDFAFNFDITGLQTFTPFNTLSNWGWHSGPIPAGESIANFKGQVWDTHGRPVRYPMPDPQRPALSQWMSSNPHRINLGRVGLYLVKENGQPVLPSDLKDVSQKLDLWAGVATSRFVLDGVAVMVKTACHPTQDSLAVQIFSPLIKLGRLKVFFACPGDNPLYHAANVGDWSSPAKLSLFKFSDGQGATLTRKIEGGGHALNLRWIEPATIEEGSSEAQKLTIHKAEFGADSRWADVLAMVQTNVNGDGLAIRAGSGMPDAAPGVGKTLKVLYSLGSVAQEIQAADNTELRIAETSEQNRIYLTPVAEQTSISFACNFAKTPSAVAPPEQIFAASRKHWPAYWKSGAAIDLSESTDPRWKELERRIVLSQYLMAVNEAGSLPPQESGLVNNTWYGRFHMEMIWWHGAHWALWNRWPQLNNYLNIYKNLMPDAKTLAASQGYKGSRWPKCLGSTLKEWPDEIHALLIWQQPHPIFLLNLNTEPTQPKAP